MVQKSHWKPASISSLENTDSVLILVLPRSSLARKEVDYFPANELNQKARTFQETWVYKFPRPSVYAYTTCMWYAVSCPLGCCGGWGSSAERAGCFVFLPTSWHHNCSQPTVIWQTPTENSISSQIGGSFGSQREPRCKCFLLIWAGACIPFEDSGNSLLGSETHLLLLVQLQSPAPLSPRPPPMVLTAPCQDSPQPLWPLLVLTALSSTTPRHWQYYGQLTELLLKSCLSPDCPSLWGSSRGWMTTYRGCHIQRMLLKHQENLCIEWWMPPQWGTERWINLPNAHCLDKALRSSFPALGPGLFILCLKSGSQEGLPNSWFLSPSSSFSLAPCIHQCWSQGDLLHSIGSLFDGLRTT